MSQETKIIDVTNDGTEKKSNLSEEQKSRMNVAGAAIAGTLGAAAVGAGAYALTEHSDHVHFNPEPVVIPVPVVEHSHYDKMPYKEAFAEARHHLGAGHTFYWHGHLYSTNLASEVPHHYRHHHHHQEAQRHVPIQHDPVIIHDHPPFASWANDNMSFTDAFNIAREQVGPGGYFTWHNANYTTYTNYELSSMTPQQVDAVSDILKHQEIHIPNIDHHVPVPTVDVIPPAIVHMEANETVHQQMIDADSEGRAKIKYHHNGSVHFHGDLYGDGKDYKIVIDKHGDVRKFKEQHGLHLFGHNRHHEWDINHPVHPDYHYPDNNNFGNDIEHNPILNPTSDHFYQDPPMDHH